MARMNLKYLTDQLFEGGDLISGTNAGILPNPDKLLEKIGGDRQIYDDMLNDDHISSVVDILVSGVLRHPWYVQSDNKKKQKELENEFKKLKIHDVIKTIIIGKLMGMAIFEIVWENIKGVWTIKKLLPLDNRDFSFDSEGNMIYQKQYKVFDKKYKYKFLIYKNQPQKNPYGVAEILKCYYPWQFKKGGWRFWLTTTEKYGVPTIVVEYDEDSIIGDAKVKTKEHTSQILK